VAHCPIANARLGHGVAPILALRASGVTVGLGTDSVGSNNRLDLLEEARFAAVLQRATSRRYDVLASPDLLRLATIEGARALGLDDQIGTLEPGKEADLCAVSIGAPHTLPVHDPVATLFHAARGTDVVLTVVGGEVLYEEETHHTVDVAAARMAVLAAGRRTAGGAGGRMENGGA
jgi:5-methylthioadenosine/S-adenosylhomocysteine deaminase